MIFMEKTALLVPPRISTAGILTCIQQPPIITTKVSNVRFQMSAFKVQRSGFKGSGSLNFGLKFIINPQIPEYFYPPFLKAES
jgi:hypothetical protein